MTEYAIELKNVSKSFHSQKVIHDVNMHVKKGEIYGFIGSNGAGKSTIMKMILGLVNADSGEIKIFGKHMDENNFEAKKQIGSIIESPFFYERLSGRKNLEIHAKYMEFDNQNSIDQVLDLVSLSQVAAKKVSQYSLGMKQRLAIARSILTHPQLLILDEPINALDPQGIMEMRTLFRSLCDEFGITILLSSHILSEIEHIVDRIGIIKEGYIIKESDKECYQEQYIKLIVNNQRSAENILSQHNIPYILDKDKCILVKSTDITIEKLSILMTKNNIPLSGLSMVKQGLEDYFFEMTT
ncbi:MAG: ABC transporter ATP-binding protein [Blautia sp.]